MYWTDRGTKKIRRANLDGTRSEDLVTHPAKAPTRRQVPTCISPAWRAQPFSGSTPGQPLVGVMPVLQVVEQHS